MKSKIKLIIFSVLTILFVSCSKKSNITLIDEVHQKKETVIVDGSNNDIVVSDTTEEIIIKGDNNQVSTESSNGNQNITNSEIYNHHTDDPEYWTIENQKEIYEELFEKKELSEVLRFRTFVESLAKYHHNDPLYEYNPVFLCYEKYPENLQFFLTNRKDLFLSGNRTWGDYSESPFLYVVKNKSLEDVKFYFENEIPVLETKEEWLYGSRNAGGPRFGIGGNILLYINDEEIRNYLISKGVPSEIDAVSYFDYFLKKDNVDVYETPGFNNPVLATITKGEKFTALKVQTYLVDNEKWMKIKINDTEGWIPQSSFDYDTGI